VRILVTGLGTFWGSRIAQALEQRDDVEPGLPRYNRGMVMEQAERIRSLVQSEVDDLLRNRRSVWRG